METVRFPTGHVPNLQAAGDAPFGRRQAERIDRTGVDAARVETAAWTGYRPAPLVALPGLARRPNLAAIGSEGSTDPETFERVVGRPPKEVRR